MHDGVPIGVIGDAELGAHTTHNHLLKLCGIEVTTEAATAAGTTATKSAGATTSGPTAAKPAWAATTKPARTSGTARAAVILLSQGRQDGYAERQRQNYCCFFHIFAFVCFSLLPRPPALDSTQIVTAGAKKSFCQLVSFFLRSAALKLGIAHEMAIGATGQLIKTGFFILTPPLYATEP